MVARYRISRPVDRPKGARRLLRILVVAHRVTAPHGQEADLPRAGRDVVPVVADDPGVASEDEARRLRAPPGAGYRPSHPERLRRGERVDEEHARVVAQQALLG